MVVHEVRRVTLSSIIRGEQVEGLASEPVEDSDFGLRVSTKHVVLKPLAFAHVPKGPKPLSMAWKPQLPTQRRTRLPSCLPL